MRSSRSLRIVSGLVLTGSFLAVPFAGHVSGVSAASLPPNVQQSSPGKHMSFKYVGLTYIRTGSHTGSTNDTAQSIVAPTDRSVLKHSLAKKSSNSLKRHEQIGTGGGPCSQVNTDASGYGYPGSDGNVSETTCAPIVPSSPLNAAGATKVRWNGLSALSNWYSGTGAYANSNLSLRPPDQGLCEGNGYTLETVNDVLEVYTSNGVTAAGPEPLAQFDGLTPIKVGIYGLGDAQLPSDPRCYYDWSTQRWFYSDLDFEYSPAAGFGYTEINIAVSSSSNPLGGWYHYIVPTGEALSSDEYCGSGGAFFSGGCLPDQPLMGIDQYGLYISTNVFTGYGYYEGAEIYAFGKNYLEAPATAGCGSSITSTNPCDITTVGYEYGPYPYLFSVQPAVNPPGAPFAQSTVNGFFGGGVEYFLSTNDIIDNNYCPTYNACNDNTITESFLFDTSALDTGAPAGGLVSFVAPNSYVAFYFGHANNCTQTACGEAGLPYQCTCLNANTFFGFPQADGPRPVAYQLSSKWGFYPGPEHLDLGDDRMMEVMFDGTYLWSSATTAVEVTGDSQDRSGIIEWKVLANSADIVGNAYEASSGYFIAYPANGITSADRGLVQFDIGNQNMHPANGWVSLNNANVAQATPGSTFGSNFPYSPGTFGSYTAQNLGTANEVFQSPVPYDDCYGYTPSGSCNGTASSASYYSTRWGDYSYASVDANGTIYTAGEATSQYRVNTVNWSTEVYSVSSY